MLVIGDPHAKVSSISEIVLLGQEIVRILRERKDIALVVILGDLHDTKETAHVLAFNAIIQLLQAVSSICWTIYTIGNHDTVNNSWFLDDNHFFNAMKAWDSDKYQLTIVDRPFWLDDSDVFSDLKPSESQKGFAFVPYVPPGRFMEALSQLPSWEKARAIFCHQEFLGAKLGAIESKHGDPWQQDYPQVISGHIHEHQELFGGKVVYVGTPYTTGFGEKDRKTVSIFTFSNDGCFEERVELNIPRKETIKVSINDIDSLELPENSKIRLSIEGTTAELNAFKKTKRYKQLEDRAKVVCRPTDTDMKIQTIERQSYIGLLKSACEKESGTVKKIFDEVTQSEKS